MSQAAVSFTPVLSVMPGLVALTTPPSMGYEYLGDLNQLSPKEPFSSSIFSYMALPTVSSHLPHPQFIIQSDVAEPDTVDKLLAKEVKEGFMLGPFTGPPFPAHHISPIGITTRKYF